LSDEAFHWPPELLKSLIDVIPLLCRSKKDVLAFFRGAGVPEAMLADWRGKLEADPQSVSKYGIANDVLTRLSERGDGALGVRRTVLQRVTEFESYSTCWPDDQLRAKGLVAEVRQLVNVKDSFTRMKQERDAEQQARQAERKAAVEKAAARRAKCRDLHARLCALYPMTDANKRGTALETILNEVFAMDGLSIRDSFVLRREDGQAAEQIDGAIELDGEQYLVEMKWWKGPLGVDAVSRHLVRVYGRSGARGLFISESGYTQPAIDECQVMLAQRVIVLTVLRELLDILERHQDIADWLRAKVRNATVERKVLS
jgi:hypothetical protein